MRTSENGLKLIQAWEGLGDGDPRTVNLEYYYCSAHVATVGWGHALTTPAGQIIDYDVFGRAKADVLAKAAMMREFGKLAITKDEATALLAKDIVKYEDAVAKVCDESTYQGEYDAMVSMCYNIGVGGFASSAVARLHKAKQRKVGNVSVSGLKTAAISKAAPTTIQIAFVRWCNANGIFALGLFRRRLSEVLVYGGHPLETALSTARAAK